MTVAINRPEGEACTELGPDVGIPAEFPIGVIVVLFFVKASPFARRPRKPTRERPKSDWNLWQ